MDSCQILTANIWKLALTCRPTLTLTDLRLSILLAVSCHHHIRFWYLWCCGCPGLRGRQPLSLSTAIVALTKIQGDHLSGKPGNVRELHSCQGNVRDFTKNQGNVRENILSGKSCLGGVPRTVREFHIVLRVVTLRKLVAGTSTMILETMSLKITSLVAFHASCRNLNLPVHCSTHWRTDYLAGPRCHTGYVPVLGLGVFHLLQELAPSQLFACGPTWVVSSMTNVWLLLLRALVTMCGCDRFCTYSPLVQAP